MKHTERIAPVAAAVTAVTTVMCCLPVGFAAAAATASLAAVVSSLQPWFLAASALLLIVGAAQLGRAQRTCPARGRGSQAIFGVSAAIVVLVILFPQVLAGLLADWLP